MKKTFSLFVFSLLLFGAGRAQVSKTNPVIAAQMKSDMQAKMAYNAETGNALTASITGKLAGPLSMTAAQQKGMNGALYDFFNGKSGFLNLKRTDPASYQAQQYVLLGNFTTQLAGFLSADQLSKFKALKPPAGDRSNLLSLVFY